MIDMSMKFFDVRYAASALSFAAHARFISETPAQAAFHDREVRNAFAGVVAAIEKLQPQPETYLVVDEDGTFREAQRGQTRASVVEDIATGEYEAEQVFRLCGPLCEDVTDSIAEEALDALRSRRFGNLTFIPSLVAEYRAEEAEALRLSWMTPAERKAERDEINADYAYEAMRERMMDAAE